MAVIIVGSKYHRRQTALHLFSSKVQGRQVGWVRLPAPEYCRPVRRIAVRCRKTNGQWAVAVLISTLCPAEVLGLAQPTPVSCSDPANVLLAYVYFYDQRRGGVETSFTGDQQGLGSTKRSKKPLPPSRW